MLTVSKSSEIFLPISFDNESFLFLLSKNISTLSLLTALLNFEPLNNKSLVPLPRKDFMDCSPSTNRIASTTFDLPDPFGPTIAVIGASTDIEDFLPKDLKPFISKVRKVIKLKVIKF